MPSLYHYVESLVNHVPHGVPHGVHVLYCLETLMLTSIHLYVSTPIWGYPQLNGGN